MLNVMICKKCSLHLVNQTETEIKAHEIQCNPRILSPRGKKKKAFRPLFESNEKPNSQMKKEIKRLKKTISSLQKKRIPHVFYDSDAWLTLKYRAIKTYGRVCMACKSIHKEIHVDHIKPRSLFPELELRFENLQILCRDCNLGKRAWDQTDWRIK